eukprot:COSAG06_NODE_958_length_11320_cov_10.832724_4_plen_129_part_00
MALGSFLADICDGRQTVHVFALCCSVHPFFCVRRNLTNQTPTPVLGFFSPAAKNLVVTFTTSKTFLKNNFELVENIVDDHAVRESLATLIEEFCHALVDDPHDELGVVRISDGVSRINGEAPNSGRRV